MKITILENDISTIIKENISNYVYILCFDTSGKLLEYKNLDNIKISDFNRYFRIAQDNDDRCIFVTMTHNLDVDIRGISYV